MVRINLSFSGLNDSKFFTKASHIQSSMTNNPNFTDPAPTLKEIDDALNTYRTDLTAAEGLGKVNVSNKNTSRKSLTKLLVKLGKYVMFVALDENALLSSGYDLSKTPQPRQLLPLGNVVLKNGNTSGTMTAKVKRGNAYSFIFDITQTPPDGEAKPVWTSYASSTCKFSFQGLTAGTQYFVKVAAVGYRKQVVYSNIASFFVQ